MIDSIDMRSDLPLARDQGVRPTCLAFAMSDAHMFAAKCGDLLSPEYLHYHAAKRFKVGLNEAVDVASARDALKDEGQPSEADCPYSDPQSDTWSPPTTFKSLWKRDSKVSAGTPSDVLTKALLAKQAPVLALRISRSFHSPHPHTHVIKEDGGHDQRWHAAVIVGMREMNGAPAFLARNSWGQGWGDGGYAWLPLTYVDARAVDIIAMEVGVS